MSSMGAHQDAPAASEVVAALGRVLASSAFCRAPSLSRLLSHVVERRLRGDACSLKEYALGVEVFTIYLGLYERTDHVVTRVLAGGLDPSRVRGAALLGEFSAIREGDQVRRTGADDRAPTDHLDQPHQCHGADNRAASTAVVGAARWLGGAVVGRRTAPGAGPS